MSALSKRFLSTWRSFPVMDFDTDLQLLRHSPKRLFNFVVGSLERRRTSVHQRLSLKSSICGYMEMMMDLKLSHCVGLQSIEIYSAAKLIRAVKFKHCKALGSIRIYSNTLESFTCIYDYHWQRPGSSDRVSDIDLSSPESLKHLRLVNMDITDEWFRNNLSQFVGLESLQLKICSRLKNIPITGENNKS
ncbi:LRR domain containing protein [Parasponia andersonii]|uniref:LRR domain containing protein n=1 Tax=Parasponia andersonii TaxID=3476 RepID=A0A2P5DQD8_PARAD|nr:LRR domain containing protein [Parasponia andersonii]